MPRVLAIQEYMVLAAVYSAGLQALMQSYTLLIILDGRNLRGCLYLTVSANRLLCNLMEQKHDFEVELE